jgi:hypothetical protein
MSKKEKYSGIRQGDVYLKRIDKLPTGNLKSVNRLEIAYGEVTGHVHRLMAELNEDVKMLEDDKGNLYLQVINPVVIKHGMKAGDSVKTVPDAHKELPVAPGTYKYIPQREYDFDNEFKKVID